MEHRQRPEQPEQTERSGQSQSEAQSQSEQSSAAQGSSVRGSLDPGSLEQRQSEPSGRDERSPPHEQECNHSFLEEGTVQDVARTFKTLGDPTRIRILYLLAQEECSVGHIAEVLHMSQSAVSHQLAVLRNLRLVKHRRDGQQLYYSSDDDHVIRLLQQAIDHASHT